MEDDLTVANLGYWMPEGISGEGKGDGCVDKVGWSISEEMEGVLPVDKSGWLMSEVMKPEDRV